MLDQFITKHDVTKGKGKLFESNNKTKKENDKFNQKMIYRNIQMN